MKRGAITLLLIVCMWLVSTAACTGLEVASGVQYLGAALNFFVCLEAERVAE